MDQTPAHEEHNPDLLSIIPGHANVIVEVGCSSGALAREAKKLDPARRYVGVEIAAEYAPLARRHCDQVIEADIEAVDEATMRQWGADCWVFGDSRPLVGAVARAACAAGGRMRRRLHSKRPELDGAGAARERRVSVRAARPDGSDASSMVHAVDDIRDVRWSRLQDRRGIGEGRHTADA